MKNRSVMQHAFSRVPQISIPRSVFNRSSGYKTTFDAGYLIPFYVDEALPGDSMNLRCTILMRLLSSAVKPFMDNLFVDTFWFFVPNRLIWTNFRKFMGEQDNPTDSISFLVPQITSPNVAGGGIPEGHLYDFMGLPVGALSGGGGTTGLTFNNLHGRAYNLIYNQWFRDQNLQTSVVVDVDDGPDTFTDYNLLRRGKRHDYFTSALPFLQKGTAVALPLGVSAPVVPLNPGSSAPKFDSSGVTDRFLRATAATAAVTLETAPTITDNIIWSATGGSGLVADLSTATAATINSIRQAVALQQLLENDARGGTRYVEIVKAHFGVTSPDARLQRSELLATYSGPFKINPVAVTSASGVGNLAAFGTGVQNSQGFTKSFTEHGVIIGLVSVRADLTYWQGVDRMWNRRTRYDYFWPELATLGEQSIPNREIFANVPDGTTSVQKDGIFGYIPRYDEYRFKNSKVTGLLRPSAAGSLDVWHLSQDFATLPIIGNVFISEDPPIDRVITTPSEPHFILDAFFDLKHARPVPTFGVPGLHKL